MKEVYESYFPELDLPLIVSFANHLKNLGYSVKVDFDLYDLLVYNSDDTPILGVMSAKRFPTPDRIMSVIEDETPEKVILVENPGDEVEATLSAKMYMLGGDLSIYLNRIGWVYVRGGQPKSDFQQWKFGRLARYRRAENGEWVKKCVFCETHKTLDNFYRRHRWGGRIRDPYRNVCKACWKERYYQRA